MLDLDHKLKTQSFVILFALVISLFAPFTLTTANPGLILQIPQPTVAPNQPVYIEYYTNLGEDGTIQLDITKPPLLAIFWQSGPMPITGGLLNSITAPGFNDPGTYVVSASVTLPGPGGYHGHGPVLRLLKLYWHPSREKPLPQRVQREDGC